MANALLSVVSGYIVWTLVFLGGSVGIREAFASAHTASGATSAGLLFVYLALSLLASLLAGFTSVQLSRHHAMRHVLILAGLLLATGIPVQISVWDTLPVWYHLSFLAALVPMTCAGGRLADQRV